MAQGGLGEQSHRAIGTGLGPGQGVDIFLPLEQPDRLGGHRHGAHRFLVALVADVRPVYPFRARTFSS